MSESPERPFFFGPAGALIPFALYLGGVAWLGLSGAPDERGFWPVLLGALAVALVLSRDRRATADAMLAGMSRPIVMVMVMAWLIAGVLGSLLGASGLVQALVDGARSGGVHGSGFVAAAFVAAALIATATGTSLGTILVVGPVLYPAGGPLGADPGWLIGAILAGATFGDSISPVSDTTIASATTQEADLGGTVVSRLKYALPAGALAAVAYLAVGGGDGGGAAPAVPGPAGSRLGLVMLLVPALVVWLLLRKRHLLEGLLAGVAAAIGLGLATGLIAPRQLLYIDAAKFGARGLLVEGMERGVGASVFTILLMGLVAVIERSGLLARLIDHAAGRARSARSAELWIVGTLSAAVVLTTHSVVAILTVGDFTRATGRRVGLSAYRRANLLDLVACTYPFLFPFFIPTILAASTTGTPAMPRVSPWQAGLHNMYSWGLVLMVAIAVGLGYGRSSSAGRRPFSRSGARSSG